ncbi:MAG: hypothetical protein JO317_00860, partial [Verrucomicrobiae bacterium]|nr:hypothetical protein [Verrucomicrobiae bacterium]
MQTSSSSPLSSPASTLPQESLQGTLEKFIYHNEDNHYLVATLTPDRGARDKVTIVGNLVGVQCGEV